MGASAGLMPADGFSKRLQMSHDALLRPIRNWLIEQALGEPDIVELFDTLCRRLAAVGLPISRARLIWQTLHPLFRAETVIWDRGDHAHLDQFLHQDQETESWKQSPLKFVLENRLDILRRKLNGPDQVLDFGMLRELKEKGVTDYLVMATAIEHFDRQIGLTAESPRGIIVTWATDRENGFSPDDLDGLQSIQRALAVCCKTAIQARIATNIAATYLGKRAGRSVLDGNIRRGDGETTRAVVWYSDLRDSTMSAENMESDAYFAMLNAYFEATAGPLAEQGGEVLDFIGDAVLGIFPFADDSEMRDAAKAASAALDQSLALGRERNAEREEAGLDRFKFGVGLNVGDVKFGNIGIPQRLSFSVIGRTVNEVARIENMTKLLQQPVLASGSLARLAPERWKSVGEHKLDGVLDPVELFALRTTP
jgi:adenylate cyclase